jgi:hypothetical protein
MSVNYRTTWRIDFPVGAGLNGIIAHLTQKCGGNVHDKGIVEVTVSSLEVNNMAYHGKNVVDYSSSRHFGTGTNDNPWICFDFKDSRVVLTDYTMVSDRRAPGWNPIFLRSWVVEGSRDGKEWIDVDRQMDCEALNGPDKSSIFKIQSKAEFRFVRIRALAVHRPGDLICLEMKAIEFFGTLITCENK